MVFTVYLIFFARQKTEISIELSIIISIDVQFLSTYNTLMRFRLETSITENLQKG
jgi:hypothetical protein